MIVSGDREVEVRYLAEQVGITEIHAEKSPEEKLAIVRREQPPPGASTSAMASTTLRLRWPRRLAWRLGRTATSRRGQREW